jgi:hypothetical protein
MHINWDELLQVFGATVGSSALLVTLFSLGVRGLARQSATKEDQSSINTSDALPMLYFVLSFAIVAFGIYLIVKN